jgi:hypothetical protein
VKSASVRSCPLRAGPPPWRTPRVQEIAGHWAIWSAGRKGSWVRCTTASCCHPLLLAYAVKERGARELAREEARKWRR